MDCLVGFAVAAVTAPIPYCKPKIVDKVGTIKLVEARHPCLELLDNINFIPNSIDFDEVNYRKVFSISPPKKKPGLCWAVDVICVKFTARLIVRQSYCTLLHKSRKEMVPILLNLGI